MATIKGCPNNFTEEFFYENTDLKKCNKCPSYVYEDGILSCDKLNNKEDEDK